MYMITATTALVGQRLIVCIGACLHDSLCTHIPFKELLFCRAGGTVIQTVR